MAKRPAEKSGNKGLLIGGIAGGVVLLAGEQRGVPIHEFSPAEVKKAVVGTGAADKQQVAFMIARLLPTAGSPTADAADALAVAITHAHARTARNRLSGVGDAA